MKVKLCGFTQRSSLLSAIDAKCDFIGFVFYKKSPRYISPKDASILATEIPQSISKVAVLVNPDFNLLEEINKKIVPDFFQFHGQEDVNFLIEVKKKFPKTKIIKAFRIINSSDFTSVINFEDIADFFLFDGTSPGSGKSFNWEILKNFSSKKDWFLSGGLNYTNLDEALKITGAKMIDISSGIEKYRGEKSSELIQELMTKVRKNAS